LAAGQSLNNTFVGPIAGERSCPTSAVTIHSVAVDRTPYLPIRGGHSITELIAAHDFCYEIRFLFFVVIMQDCFLIMAIKMFHRLQKYSTHFRNFTHGEQHRTVLGI